MWLHGLPFLNSAKGLAENSENNGMEVAASLPGAKV